MLTIKDTAVTGSNLEKKKCPRSCAEPYVTKKKGAPKKFFESWLSVVAEAASLHSKQQAETQKAVQKNALIR